MLKSSDRISHDIEILQERQHPLASQAAETFPAVLALCKWCELRPEREFRCFVRGGVLVGASQRDISQHYPQLTSSSSSLGTSVREDTSEEITNGHIVPDRLHPASAVRADAAMTRDRGGPLQEIKMALSDFHTHHVVTAMTPPMLQDCE